MVRHAIASNTPETNVERRSLRTHCCQIGEKRCTIGERQDICASVRPGPWRRYGTNPAAALNRAVNHGQVGGRREPRNLTVRDEAPR
jgi:hypothetical protein